MNRLNIDAYISCQKEKSDKPYDKSNFEYEGDKDEYICPEGKSLVFHGETFDKKKNKTLKIYKGTACKKCPNQERCTKRKDGVRHVKRYSFEKEREQMKKKMQTNEAKETYKFRKQIVEFVFGDFKENKGVITFLTKSLETVRTEFNLMSIASNLDKIWKKKLKKIEKSVRNIRLEIKKLCVVYVSA